MRLRTTTILLVVLGALIALYFVTKKSPGTSELAARAKRLLTLDAEKVERLELVRGPTRIVLAKEGERWRMTAPLEARASKTDVQSLVRDLETLSYTEQVDPADVEKRTLKGLGLEPPAASVTVTAAGRTATVLVGQPTPRGREVYAQTDRKTGVYTIGKSFADTLAKEPNAWRDKDLFEFTRANVTRLVLDRTDSPQVALAKEAGAWRLTAPIADQADDGSVGTLLDRLDSISADSFADDDPKDLGAYGLAKPMTRVAFTEVTDKGETRDHLLLLGRGGTDTEPKFYAKTGEEKYVYTVGDLIPRDLAVTVFALRQKKLATFETSQAVRLDLKAPGREIVLATDTAGAWQLERPRSAKTESGTVTAFLDDLKGATAEQFLDTAPAALADLGLDEAQRTTIAVTIRPDAADTKADKVLTYFLGKRSADGRFLYAMREKDTFALAARTKLDETVALGDLAFRDRLVLEFERAKARELVVVRDGLSTTVSRPDDKDDWSMTAPVRAKTDYSGPSNILWDLYNLRAKKLVAEKPADLKPFGLDAPAVTVTVAFKDKTDETKTIRKTLQVGAKTETDAFYARLTDGDLVFTLDKSVVENLKAELHERTVMEFSKDKVTAVTVTHAGQAPFVFLKTASGWSLEGREALGLKIDAIEDILNALYYLRTERFAAYQATDLKPFGLDAPRLTVLVKLGEEERRILVGNALAEGKVLAKTADKPAVFELSQDQAAKLLRYLADYLSDPTATQPSTRPAPTTTTAPGG